MSVITGSYVNSGLSYGSVRSLNNLDSIHKALERSLEALGTGYKFNSAAEAPAASVAFTRLRSKIDSVNTAVENNQQSYFQLSGVDSAQSQILKTLMEIRTLVQDTIGEVNPDVRRVLLGQVSSKLGAIDNVANAVGVGGKKVLAGEGKIDLTPADSLLRVDESNIRTIRRNAYVSASFEGSNAAERAVVSDNYHLPQSSLSEAASVFRITSDKGTRNIHLVTDLTPAQAIAQMNSQLAEIGVHVEEDSGKLFFITDTYGRDASLKYEHVSGTQLLTGSDSQSGKGATGNITVNGRNYAINGQYVNDAPQQATLSGAYAASVVAGTEVTIATQNQTGATYTFGAGTTIDAAAVADMDTFFSAYGVRASLEGGMLVFKSADYGDGQVLSYSNGAGTQLFTDGASFTRTGRDYVKGDGLYLNVASTDLSATFALDPQKVVRNAITGATPQSEHFSFQPEGGVFYQIGDNAGFYDSVTYGFRNLTSEGMGLDKIIDNSSPFFMLDDPVEALRLVDSILSTMRSEYGALGSFMSDYLDKQTNTLNKMIESLNEQAGALANVNEAYETSRVVKLQLLQQANISALSSENSYSKALAQLLPSAG